MVRPDMEKWGQTLADLRVLSVEAKDARSRERFLALYMIADKQTSACAWARTIGRTKETVLQMGTCLQSVGAGGRVLSSYGWSSPFFSLGAGQATRERYLRDRTCRAWTAGSWLDVEKAAALAQAGHGLRSRPQHAAQDSASSAVALEKVSESTPRKPTHRNVRPLWNASKSCMNNSVARRFVWSILMKPTSTAIWTWATPGPKRTRLPGV